MHYTLRPSLHKLQNYSFCVIRYGRYFDKQKIEIETASVWKFVHPFVYRVAENINELKITSWMSHMDARLITHEYFEDKMSKSQFSHKD